MALSISNIQLSVIPALVAALNADRRNPGDQIGVATLVAGTVTVTGVTFRADSRIMLTRNTPGGTVGDLSAPVASRNSGTGQFVINSANAADTSTIDWRIVTPVTHYDVTSTGSGDYSSPVAAPLLSSVAVASSLPTSIALANDLLGKLNTHFADAVAHAAADTTNGPLTTPVAVDLPTTQTMANALKAAWNAHLTQTGVHPNKDSVNTVATTAAVDQSTSNALLNAIQTAYNAHIQQARPGTSIALHPG